MEFKDIASQLWGAGIVAVIGGISFFLKRAINKVDVFVEKLEVIESKYAPKEVVDKVEKNLTEEIEQLESKFCEDIETLEEKIKTETSKMENSINEHLKTISDDIKEMQRNNISKEDLHRQVTSIDRKIEQLTEFMMKGAK